MTLKQVFFYFLVFLTVSSCGFKDEEDYYNEALIFQGAGEYDRAIASLDKAIARNPDYMDAYVLRGFCNAALGNIKKSMVEYKKALALEPNNTMTLYNLAINCGHAKEYKEAASYLTKALKSNYVEECAITTREESLIKVVFHEEDPDKTGYEIEACKLYFLRGLSYFNSEDYELAIADFNNIARGSSYYTSAFFYLGEIYIKKGDVSKACTYFQKAVDLGNISAQENTIKYCKELSKK